MQALLMGLLVKGKLALKVDTHGLLSFKRGQQAATASLQGFATSHQGDLPQNCILQNSCQF